MAAWRLMATCMESGPGCICHTRVLSAVPGDHHLEGHAAGVDAPALGFLQAGRGSGAEGLLSVLSLPDSGGCPKQPLSSGET